MNPLDLAVADIPRSITAIAEWGSCMVFVAIVGRRVRWPATIALALGGLVLLVGVQSLAGMLPLSWWIPGMLAAVATMFVFLFSTLRVSPLAAGYLTARSFVLAELTASAYWQLDRFYSGAPLAVRAIMLVLTYALVLGLAWLAERRHLKTGSPVDAGPADLIGALAIAAVTFSISNLSFVNSATPFSGSLGPEILYIRTLVDLSGYIALYVQQEARSNLQARREADAMSRLLQSQHDQYQISRRAIDEVNRKYHDMKHHIDAIRAEPDAQAKMRMMGDLESSISDYGTQVLTGNSVLDAVLTAKQMYARENDIHLTAVADGRLIEFMRPLDLVGIVGNALDNAFEATARLPRPERMVTFSLFAHETFVIVRVENAFDGYVLRRNGRIVTRKVGSEHGYGLRNIEAAAESYGGSSSVSAAEKWFSLRVLLPRVPSPTP